jgi:hypothetical protein
VTPTEHTAKSASTPKAGLLATLGAFLHAGGSGARSSGGARLALLSVLAVCVIALTAAPAQALNPERHYEMVSPIYKAGFGAEAILAASPDGESLAFASPGVFDGTLSGKPLSNPYLARRGASGWSTVGLGGPNSPGMLDVSANLEYVLAGDPLGPNSSASHFASEEAFLLHPTDTPDTAENWSVAGGIIVKRLDTEPGDERVASTEVGASPDLCHIFIQSQGQLLATAEGRKGQIYELVRGCDGEPATLRLVDLTNSGHIANPNKCAEEVTLGIGGGAVKGSSFNAIDADGRQVLFTINVSSGPQACSYYDAQLFLRLDGRRTLEVSKPLTEAATCAATIPCPGAAARAPAYFSGASEDGSRVYFTTTASLSAGDGDSQNDLYLATIGCPTATPECAISEKVVTSLTQASHAQSGEAAEVQGVVKIAPDGSRAYFVARGVLSSNANSRGARAVKGADNLYVYDATSGQNTFIAALEEGDTSLWQESGGEVQSAGPDARYLVFSTYAQLVASDTDNAKDVYRYDAQTGALVRVSVGEGGYAANGNSNDGSAIIEPLSLELARVVEQRVMVGRAISEDGSRVVFTSAAALSPNATNRLRDLYEWHDGGVSMISSGSATSRDAYATISASGRDVFFVTGQGLVPQDTDGQRDVYDARLGEGFPAEAAKPKACEGDACQGPLTNPAPLLVPGSVVQEPGQNLAAPAPAVAKAKAKSKPAKCRKGFVKKKTKCVKKPKARKSTRGKGSK